MDGSKILTTTNRTKLKTLPKRGDYSTGTIYKILDDAFVCHIGFASEGQTFVLPVAYGRGGNKIYFHGGKGSRLFKTIRTGVEICITVTVIDGLVLAKSAFHHSVNYRSVVIFGKTEELQTAGEKINGLKIIMEHLLPGRWDDTRTPSEKELNATMVLSVNLDEASSKIRTGPPVEEEQDTMLNLWSGVIPIKMKPGKPIPAPGLNEGINVPGYIIDYIKRVETF